MAHTTPDAPRCPWTRPRCASLPRARPITTREEIAAMVAAVAPRPVNGLVGRRLNQFFGA